MRDSLHLLVNPRTTPWRDSRNSHEHDVVSSTLIDEIDVLVMMIHFPAINPKETFELQGNLFAESSTTPAAARPHARVTP